VLDVVLGNATNSVTGGTGGGNVSDDLGPAQEHREF